MRELFRLDSGDYNPDGKRFCRNSSRGIVIRDKKVLLIYSPKYNYYKFPGGGIEAGEDNIAALKREVAEESGYRVKEDGIEEFGSVLRLQRDVFDENAVFEQGNFYYLCDVEDECGERNLDDYERDEGFTVVWMEPLAASRHDLTEVYEGADPVMVKREARVLELLDSELKKRNCSQ